MFPQSQGIALNIGNIAFLQKQIKLDFCSNRLIAGINHLFKLKAIGIANLLGVGFIALSFSCRNGHNAN